MSTPHDVEALLLLSTLMAAKRRPAELVEILAAADLLHGAIPAVGKLGEAFARLGRSGLLLEQDGCYHLSPAALALEAELPRKADAPARLLALATRLQQYRPQAEGAPILLAAEQFSSAINAHRAAAQGSGKNLLMPKPQPADPHKKRPGQRQRRPLPGQRPRRS